MAGRVLWQGQKAVQKKECRKEFQRSEASVEERARKISSTGAADLVPQMMERNDVQF